MAVKKLLIDLQNIDMNEVDTSDCTDVEDILSAVITYLSEIPIVDAEEVVHGCWADKHYKIACSVCENAVFIGTSDPLIHKEEKKNLKYCPNCGARMDGACDG